MFKSTEILRILRLKLCLPDCLPIVLACVIGQAIVDEILRVDKTTLIEPLPFFQGPIQIVG